MKEARIYFEKLEAYYSDQALHFKKTSCGGDNEIWRQIMFCSATVASKIRLKTGYFKVIPWLFSEAEDPEIAAECIRQIDATPAGALDDVSAYIAGKYRPSLEARAANQPVDQPLKTICAALNNSPLSELLGEGYHRGTSLIKRKAPAAKEIHIKAKTRVKQNITTLRNLFATGRKGIAKFRRHWYAYQGVLRTDGKRKHGVPKHLKMNRMAFHKNCAAWTISRE